MKKYLPINDHPPKPIRQAAVKKPAFDPKLPPIRVSIAPGDFEPHNDIFYNTINVSDLRADDIELIQALVNRLRSQ
jgi:hypothetical protein